MNWKSKRYYKEQNELLKLEILNLDKKNIELKELCDKLGETIEILETSLKYARNSEKEAIKKIAELNNKLKEKEAQRKAAAGKIGGYVKENHKLLKRIEELEEEKAKCWILKKLPAEKIPNTQRLRIKSSSKQSSIMKNLQKVANNED